MTKTFIMLLTIQLARSLKTQNVKHKIPETNPFSFYTMEILLNLEEYWIGNNIAINDIIFRRSDTLYQ